MRNSTLSRKSSSTTKNLRISFGANPHVTPTLPWIRWLILALASVITFGLNYSSQNPQALQPSIQAVFHIEDTKFNLLYSVYSFPNIILPLFGGLLADKIGIRFAVNLFGSLVFVGQGVFTLGAYYENFQLMVLGRFIFGLGGESLTVTQLPLLAKWFQGGELAFAYGLSKCAVRLGKSANSFMTPKIYLWTNRLSAPLIVGLTVSLISLISGFVFCYFDYKADKKEALLSSSMTSSSASRSAFGWRDFKSFPRIFYIMLTSYACLYAVIQGFSNLLTKLLVARFGFDVNFSGNIVMVFYLVSAAGGPFVGLIVDRSSRKTQLMLFITLIFFISNLCLTYLDDGSENNPNYEVGIPLIGVTIFNSVYNILFWASVAAITDKRKIGLGTGMITCVTNLSQTILPLLLGEIHDRTLGEHFGYFWALHALSFFIGIGIFLSVWIHLEDWRNGGVLNFSKQQNKVAASETLPLMTKSAVNRML